MREPRSDHLIDGVMVPRDESSYAHRIVLRDLGRERFERFVVHEQVLPDDREPFYVQGDYFRDLRQALDRFDARNARAERYLALREAAG